MSSKFINTLNPLAGRQGFEFAFVLVVVAAALAGCPRTTTTTTGCTVSTDCGANQQCDTVSGQCLCLDDSACDPSEFCNAVGKCQTVLECLDNSDCAETELCDTTTGSCLAKVPGICVLDSQCPYGSYCGANRGCTPGCRDDGDCALGTPCLNGVCDETPGACSSNAFCDYGDLCSNNRCVAHPQKSQLCEDCGGNNQFACLSDCLIDSSVAPTPCTSDSQCERGTCEPARCSSDDDCPNNGSCGFLGTCNTSICQGAFCGASDCSDSNPCPRGYSCARLQSVSGAQCTLGGPAGQCGTNRACVGGGENGEVGFCSCASDADCVQGTCENPGPNGACLIGTTCAPSDGLLCEDLR